MNTAHKFPMPTVSLDLTTSALLETPSLAFVGGMISVRQGNGQDHITLVSSPAESCRPWADLDPRVLDL
jgi:hypothetical protein